MPRKAKPADTEQSEAVEAVLAKTSPVTPTADGAPGADLPAGGINDKIRNLIRLSKEQGYLTFDDINEALPESVENQEEIDNVLSILQNLEIEILEPDQVDDYKQRMEEAEEEESRSSQHDILDDPVRMYLKQMGQVPLLTREQEVEISKRIENADNELKRIVYSFGFAGKEHIALAEKLICEPPKERFDRVVVDKKIDSRDQHLKDLRKLVKSVRDLDQQVDENYAACQGAPSQAKRDKCYKQFA